MIENLDKTICSLVKAKEKLEYERKRLAQNTELDDVIADMKRTADRLDNEILKARKLKLSLVKVSELYVSGEENIKDAVEGGRHVFKPKFAPYINFDLGANTAFRWTIE